MDRKLEILEVAYSERIPEGQSYPLLKYKVRWPTGHSGWISQEYLDGYLGKKNKSLAMRLADKY